MLIGIDASRAATAQRTGTEGYAYHLIRALAPLAIAQGHQLRLYYNQPPAEQLTSAQHEALIMPMRRLWTHRRLARELRQRPPDVFFTPAHVIPYGYQGASVATVHDLGYKYFPEAHTKQQVRYLDWSTRHNATRAERILADSQATAADLVRFYATDSTKIAVVYPGRDEQLADTIDDDKQSAILQKYGLTEPYFLYLGTLQPRKNLARLVQAFAAVAADMPHQLVLAGKQGWHAQALNEALAILPSQITDRIVLPGFVPDEEKGPLLAGATALTFPSLFEGFGFPVLEAFTCGTAVLTSLSSSLPEVAGTAAYFVNAQSVPEIATGLRHLATDEAYRQALVKAGYEQLQKFSWQTAAEQTLTCLVQATETA